MFTLITFHGDVKHSAEFDTLEETVSACMDAFNNNYELHEIKKDGTCLYIYSEVYNLINKAIY